MNVMIFGAQAMAYSLYKAFQLCYPEYVVKGFLVTSLKDNPTSLDGMAVRELADFAQELGEKERKAITIFAAAPQNQLSQIEKEGKRWGFSEWISVDSQQFAVYMEAYFRKMQGIHFLKDLKSGKRPSAFRVFAVRSARDQKLTHQGAHEEWMHEIIAGAALTALGRRLDDKGIFYDDVGENISKKNRNYCELTALYWIWKQGLLNSKGYLGLFHYRRYLELSENEICALEENGVDVVLPYPMLYCPDSNTQHSRYIKEEDWEAMKQAMRELCSEYEKKISEIFSQPYFYNYNILIAKKEILKEYCSWLFPILQRIEALSVPRGWEREDRYIGYLGENLLTLYFIFNKKRLKIVHTGLRMLT